MDGVYERPVECRLCLGPVVDPGVWMFELDVEKLRRWWRLALDVELDHDEETVDGLDSILTSCFCQFCLWNARLQSEAQKWKDCDWWTGHDSNKIYRKFYYEKWVIQPCAAWISIPRRLFRKASPTVRKNDDEFVAQVAMNVSKVSVSSSGQRGKGKTTACFYCQEQFPTRRAAHLHTQGSHSDKKPIHCCFCLKYFNTKIEKDLHQAKEHLRIVCHLCKMKFPESDPQDLKIHVFEKHILKDTMYQCCGKKLKNAHELFQHMKSIKLNFGSVCIYCKKSISHSNLTRHVVMRHKSIAISCEYSNCSKYFLNERDREAHYLEAHKHRLMRKKVICLYCFKECDSKTINLHVMRKHASVYIRCTFHKYCIAFFHTEKEREKHILEVHMKSKVVGTSKCIYCGLTLVSRTILQTHIHVQHKHQKIICRIRGCGEYFLTKTDLENHRKVQHAGMNLGTVECDQCYFSTNTELQLKQHIVNMHGVKNLKCPHCPKLCTSRQTLKGHLNSVHGQKKLCVHCQTMVPTHRVHLHVKVHPCKFCKDIQPCRSLQTAHWQQCVRRPGVMKRIMPFKGKRRKTKAP